MVTVTDASGEDGVSGYAFSADAPGEVWLHSATAGEDSNSFTPLGFGPAPAQRRRGPW